MFYNASNSSTVIPACRMSFLSRLGAGGSSLFENIIIIYLIMMANKTELSMTGINKLEYDPVRDIHPKAPDLVTFGMEFLESQGWMKRVVLEKVWTDSVATIHNYPRCKEGDLFYVSQRIKFIYRNLCLPDEFPEQTWAEFAMLRYR